MLIKIFFSYWIYCSEFFTEKIRSSDFVVQKTKTGLLIIWTTYRYGKIIKFPVLFFGLLAKTDRCPCFAQRPKTDRCPCFAQRPKIN